VRICYALIAPCSIKIVALPFLFFISTLFYYSWWIYLVYRCTADLGVNRLRENSDRNIKVLHLILSPKSVLNSLWRFINNAFHAIVCRDGINHILIGINIILTVDRPDLSSERAPHKDMKVTFIQ
jgi:hypothetical protein